MSSTGSTIGRSVSTGSFVLHGKLWGKQITAVVFDIFEKKEKQVCGRLPHKKKGSLGYPTSYY